MCYLHPLEIHLQTQKIHLHPQEIKLNPWELHLLDQHQEEETILSTFSLSTSRTDLVSLTG